MGTYENTNRSFIFRRCGLFLLLLSLASCGGGGGGGGSSTNTGSNNSGTPETVVYQVSGTIQDELQQPLAGALITVDGIQSEGLSDSEGKFIVKSENDFPATVSLTATLDGYNAITASILLSSGDTANSYKITDDLALSEVEPWGYLGFDLTPTLANQTLFKSATTSTVKACDCTVNISGKAYRQGNSQSELYIMLIVDTSGSTADNTVNGKSVFSIEIDSLLATVDAITATDKTQVAVMTFATEANMALDFTNDLALVKQTLSQLTPQASGTSGAATNYQAALNLAKSTFATISAINGDIKTVAFLSDGIPTAPFGSGTTQEAEDRLAAIEAANAIAPDGISINTFPVNIASSLTTLPTISAISQGNYYQHEASNLVNEMAKDSLVGIVGLEIVNLTNSESATSLSLAPDGRFSGNICLNANEVNQLKITPSVCTNCEKVAYQTLMSTCTNEACSTCAGQVTNLKLQYNGPLSNPTVKVLQRKNANSDYILFEAVVSAGEIFEFFGAKKDKTMGSSIQIYVNDSLNAEYVTSCGQPKIGPGLIAGDFQVMKGYSRNGGLLCPI